MHTTKTDLKKSVRNELRCPSEYIRHLAGFDVFGELKAAILSDDKDIERDIMDEIRNGYMDYCRFTDINPAEDNRKARIGFFII